MEFISKSEKDTLSIARKIAKNLKDGDIFLLNGDLGAGKTVFVKGIVEALGGDKNLVTSPTFTIINRYNVGDNFINHFDLYRLKNIEELYNLGVEEYIYSNDISFIEWPERADLFFGKNCKKIYIEKIDDTTRKINIED